MGPWEAGFDCGGNYCAPGRLDFNGGAYSSVLYGETLGIWNIGANSLLLPNFNLRTGARDRGLWIDANRFLMFYTSLSALMVYDVNANNALQWNSDCTLNSDFCAALPTVAKNMGKGNVELDLWTTNTTGTDYQSFTGGSISNVPEPMSLLLMGSGLLGIGGLGRLRKKKTG